MGVFRMTLTTEGWSRERVLNTLTWIVDNVILYSQYPRDAYHLQINLDVHGPCNGENLRAYFAFASDILDYHVGENAFTENNDEAWQVSYGSSVDRCMEILPTVLSNCYSNFCISIDLRRDSSQ